MIFQGKWFAVKVEELAEVGMSPQPKNSLYVTHKSGTQNVTNYGEEEGSLKTDYEGLVKAMKEIDGVKK